MSRQLETRIYAVIENWLRDKGYFVKQMRGMRGVGQADVIGMRAVGTKYYVEPEVVSVEVKKSKRGLGRKVTQALRYSLFSHLSYAAVPFRGARSFSELDKDIARKLGVGLLEVHERDDVREVLSPSYHTPARANILKILRRLGYIQCVLSGCISNKDGARRMKRATELYGEKKLHKYLCRECAPLLKLLKHANHVRKGRTK